MKFTILSLQMSSSKFLSTMINLSKPQPTEEPPKERKEPPLLLLLLLTKSSHKTAKLALALLTVSRPISTGYLSLLLASWRL